MKLKQLLKENQLFHACPDAILDDILTQAVERFVPEDTVVLREGEVSDEFYIIISGNALVYCQHQGQNLYLARLTAGHYFGEQALLKEQLQPRNASVMTTSNSQLLVLKREQLQQIFFTPSCT
jgi:CRP-like cAMP-binding protein